MHFKAQTYDPVKGLQHTSFEAVDLQEAESFLKSQGLSIVSIEQDNSIKHKAVKFNLLLWVSELLTLVEAGISLPEALKCIGAKENTFIGKLSLKLLKSLNEGKSLSDAMVLQDSLFPPLLIAMVKSSEVTGNLANALRRFRAYSENMEGLRTKIVSAAVYPLILLLIGGIVVLFLLGYVVPKFSGAYEYVGSDLPYLSKMLIALGGQINKYPIQFYSFGGTCLAGIAWFFISGSFMRVLPSVLYSFEAIRTRLITYELARFYRTVGLLIEGGIPVKKALAMSSGLFQIPELKSGLEKAIESVSEGKSLTASVKRFGLSTEVADSLLGAGERSGNLGEMMERIADYYDNDAAKLLDRATKLLEPALMVLLGVVIGGIVLLMYVPIFDLAGNMS